MNRSVRKGDEANSVGWLRMGFSASPPTMLPTIPPSPGTSRQCISRGEETTALTPTETHVRERSRLIRRIRDRLHCASSDTDCSVEQPHSESNTDRSP